MYEVHTMQERQNTTATMLLVGSASIILSYPSMSGRVFP